MTNTPTATSASTTKRILNLTLPALGALIAQPIFVATDTAMIGHLGETVLAGLAIGSMCITTIVGLMVFLAYTTTPVVARRLGADDRAGAIRAGFDGMWLALYCAVALLLVGIVAAGPVVSALTDDAFVESAAMSYFTISLWGLPGTLVSLAAVGLLRGLQDTRTPLVVSVAGAISNIVFNYVFIYILELGIAGSALGTALVETLMACVYIAIALQAASSEQVSIAPGIGEPRAQLRASTYMFLRTLSLRIAMVAMVWAAGTIGTTQLAALQVGLTVFNLLAFTLDALAIAAQAMIGHDLGAGRSSVSRLALQLCAWGVGFGILLTGVILGATLLAGGTDSGGLAVLFTSDTNVQLVAGRVLFAVATVMPLAGLVFVLDGILIGAADNRYLAITSAINLVVFGVALAIVLALPNLDETATLIGVWLAFGAAMMLSRAITLFSRILGERWLRVGESAVAAAGDEAAGEDNASAPTTGATLVRG